MTNVAQISKVFYSNRDMFVKRAQKRLNQKMFDIVLIENIIDNVFLRCLEGPQVKEGFENDTHILKYLQAAISKSIQVSYFIREQEMLKEIKISEQGLSENYKLARDIINKNRSISKPQSFHCQ